MSLLHHVTTPLIANNPVTLQILGICSALAVTTSLATALTMSIALTAVLCASAAIISASTEASGIAAWAPFPVTVMSKKLAPAIAGPGFTPTSPGAWNGELCRP